MIGDGISIHVTVPDALMVAQDVEDSDSHDCDLVKEQANVDLCLIFSKKLKLKIKKLL